MSGAFLYIGGNFGVQLLVFVGLIVFFMAYKLFFKRLVGILYGKFAQSRFKTGPVTARQEQIEKVLLSLPYYLKLSEPGRHKFKHRLTQILARLEFSTEGEIEVDEEKKILLATASVQITFGLEEFDIDSIEHIKVFADDIYNPKTRTRFKGLTFQNGEMFISWKHFLTGHAVHDDGVHLAIHEMAHGLYIMIKEYRGYDDFDKTLKDWMEMAWYEIDHEENGKGFLRKYASANIYELFAVCIENFFERPKEFKKRLPVIYNQLCIFLNQDPLSPDDYNIDFDTTAPMGPLTERVYLFKNRTHPSMGLLLWLSGMCVISMMFLKAYFLETLFNLLLFSIPCLFISYKSLKKFFVDSKRLSKRWYFVFCFTAINPVLFTFILLLNMSVSLGVHGKVTYRVAGVQKYGFGFNQNDLAVFEKRANDVYMLEGNYTVPLEARMAVDSKRRVTAIEYSYHYGITGFKILDSRELKYE